MSMQIFSVSEVSGSQFCKCNVNSGNETYATNLISIWRPVTTSNSQ